MAKTLATLHDFKMHEILSFKGFMVDLKTDTPLIYLPWMFDAI